MIKLNVIHQISPIKTIPEAAKSGTKIVENSSCISEISKAASESITSTQKGIINNKSKVLNIYSEDSKFFGVDSPHNIMQKIENQVNLIEMKCKQIGCIESFPKGAGFSIDNPSTMDKAWKHIWTDFYGLKQFKELYSSPARMTFYGKVFGKNGAEGAHTIGILYHPESKTLYALDSLPNSFNEVKEYQDILRGQIFSPMLNKIKIIFSNKPQQNLNEYTCNNWTLANIEALQKALEEGRIIDSVEKLNEVLPSDINKILKEQHEYVCKKSL